MKIKKNIGIKKNENKNSKFYSYKCGHKSIKLTVQKTEVLKSPKALDSIFYYSCSFCNQDFDSLVEICPDCNRPLVKINLKKCPLCGAKNNPVQRSCWICAGPFPILPEEVDKEVQLLLTLNLDNNLYRNTDKTLSLSMKKLFEDLISTNFSKEPLEAWVKIREGGIELKKEFARDECKYLVRQSQRWSLMYILVTILLIAICVMLVVAFWVK